MKYAFTPMRWMLVSTTVLFCSLANTSQFGDVDLYELGKKVYTTGAESCQTCHGINGAGTPRSKVNLGNPTSWKAFEYEAALRNTGLVTVSYTHLTLPTICSV